jgi:molybdopterin converting factor small subunit
MRDLTGGLESVAVEGNSVRKVIMHLDIQFPGIASRLLKDEELVPHIAVIVDGEESQEGLAHLLESDSEVFFLAAIAGGARRASTNRAARFSRRFRREERGYSKPQHDSIQNERRESASEEGTWLL